MLDEENKNHSNCPHNLDITKTKILFILLTCLFIEHDLIFKLLALLQGIANAEDDAFAGLQPIQELTGTALLHDLGPGEACKLTEAIRAVDDGKALRHLCIGQDEVAICREKGRKGLGEKAKKELRQIGL